MGLRPLIFYMDDIIQIREEFQLKKETLFNNINLAKDPYKFSLNLSLLVEEYINIALKDEEINFVLLSAGSFSRRELSPFSDIDIMILLPDKKGVEKEIQTCFTRLWDCGIEVSHTVRKFEDIKRFLDEDLHAFTQFFETRFLLGKEQLYYEWQQKLVKVLDKKVLPRLIRQYFDEQKQRHQKYGPSPKMLEPNIKLTAGGLRDLHIIEWVLSLQNKKMFIEQSEISQTEIFLKYLKDEGIISKKARLRLKESYGTLLKFRNLLHLCSTHKTDRLEFSKQEEIAKKIDFPDKDWRKLMLEYFDATNIIFRFSKTMVKRFDEILNPSVSPHLEINIDDDFYRKGNRISIREPRILNKSEMMRAYYYRGVHSCSFDQKLRSLIIESVIELDEDESSKVTPSVFFREILNLPQNVGTTIAAMHEVGLLCHIIPAYNDLSGFFQPGVYHSYTADEHSIVAIRNTEELYDKSNELGKTFNNLRRKDLLYMAILLHDIAKPVSVQGHEIIGADLTVSIMEELGYESDESDFVQFLVRHHLTMEQVAFRRNLNDPHTLEPFAKIFPKRTWLNYLYILTFADLSAVNPAVWTQWKGELLHELYMKTKQLLLERITADELLNSFKEDEFLYEDEDLKEHLKSIDDVAYQQHYSAEEINKHLEDINNEEKVSVAFSDSNSFTNITVITKDIDSLLARLTGALSINDLNIHDARIFTRNDGVVIDSFNVTDFRSQKPISSSRYDKIKKDLALSITNELYIDREFNKVQSKWRRLEKRLFGLKSKIKIKFEEHEKYTIIDVYAPDKLGLLYQITTKLHELGLIIDLAKIATKADDVVDAFYVLGQDGKKIPSDNYELIKIELTKSIEEIF